ncbi:hypothetical protein like AT5G48690 [Hibiscus trionum]|uniref:Uncharacterized protein n=1 Tax=Hibiscus trionum TaxID=183268 RepID=A0A9W7H4G1_HIBTR|nr:hypothetical protein like AT5G48690 [Hibiscus trionum]
MVCPKVFFLLSHVAINMDIESSQPDGITEAIKIKEQELRDRVHIKNREEEKKLEREREKKKIRAGKTLQEAKRIAEENERKRLVALRKIEEEEEKRAREKVLRKLEADKLERKRALGLPLENQAAKLSQPIAQKEEKNSLPVKSAKKDDRLRSLKLAYKVSNFLTGCFRS